MMNENEMKLQHQIWSVERINMCIDYNPFMCRRIICILMMITQ